MKKCWKWIIPVVIIGLLAAVYVGSVRVSGVTGSAVFIYGDSNVNTRLSREDAAAIAALLDGKDVYRDSVPACGFDWNVAVILDGQRFLLGCDGCGSIQSVSKLGYIDLTDEETETLHKILEAYGFYWPCL